MAGPSLRSYRKHRERRIVERRVAYKATLESSEAQWRAGNDGPNRIKRWQEKDWHRKCFYAARASSKRRGHPEPKITPEDILKLYEQQNGLCYWTGVKMTPSPIRHDPLQPSLERLDNSVGYEPGNVVLACYCINRARRDISEADFEQTLKKIAAALTVKYANGHSEEPDQAVSRLAG